MPTLSAFGKGSPASPGRGPRPGLPFRSRRNTAPNTYGSGPQPTHPFVRSSGTNSGTFTDVVGVEGFDVPLDSGVIVIVAYPEDRAVVGYWNGTVTGDALNDFSEFLDEYQPIDAPHRTAIAYIAPRRSDPDAPNAYWVQMDAPCDWISIQVIVVAGMGVGDFGSHPTAIDMYASAVGSGTTPSSGPSGITHTARQFVLGVHTSAVPTSHSPGTWQSGFTRIERGGSHDMTIDSSYLITTTAGSYIASKSGAAADAWIAAIATFRVQVNWIPIAAIDETLFTGFPGVFYPVPAIDIDEAPYPDAANVPGSYDPNAVVPEPGGGPHPIGAIGPGVQTITTTITGPTSTEANVGTITTAAPLGNPGTRIGTESNPIQTGT